MDNNKENNIGFLFDLDGVLIDSEKAYTRIWSGINDEYPTGYDNFSTRIKGTTLENILSTYYPDPETRRKVEDRLNELEQKMVYEPTEGCLEFLDTIKSHGYPVAMVTSSNDMKMQHLWNELPDLRKYFDAIIDGDCVSRSKPDPEGYLLGASRIGVEPRKCVVFEDSLQGVKAGRNSGAYVVGIRGTVAESDLAKYCDLIVDNLGQVDFGALTEILKER